MKKHILLSALLVSIFLMGTVTTFSQKFSVGARLGLDFATYSNFSKEKSDLSDLGLTAKRNTHAGFVGGVMAYYDFNKFLGLQGELLVDRKGGKMTVTGTETTFDDYGDPISVSVSEVSTVGITYLTIPILLRGGTEFGRFKIHGLLGPYFAIGLGGKAKITEDGTTTTYKVVFKKEPENPSADDKNDYHKIADVGLTIGAEPAFKLGPGDIIVDLRYNLGFIDTKNPFKKGDKYHPWCNRSFSLTFGYVITLGK